MARHFGFCFFVLVMYFASSNSIAQAVNAPVGLVPAGLDEGDEFYIIFVSSQTTLGNLTPAQFNTFANNTADLDTDTASLDWTMIMGHDDGTLTTTSAFSDTTVPIYNTNGDKIGDDRADLFDGSLDASISYDESGVDVGSVGVYVGITAVGANLIAQGDNTLGGNDTSNDGCALGRSDRTTGQAWALNVSGDQGCDDDSYSIYAISPLLKVASDDPVAEIEPPKFGLSSVTLRVGETTRFDIVSGSPTYDMMIMGPESVADITLNERRLTITGREVGMIQVRIDQAMGPSGYLPVTVLPSLEQETIAQLPQLGGNPDDNDLAEFSGGVTDSVDERYYQGGVFYVGEELSIDFAISPQPEHIGQMARIIIALRLDSAPGLAFLFDEGGEVVPFQGEPMTGYTELTLESDNLIELTTASPLIFTEELVDGYELFIGYELLATGELFYAPQALRFEVANWIWWGH
ncbi:MAG: hypothetical protein RKH07_01465 [Gammaproteobacteria bacterium]